MAVTFHGEIGEILEQLGAALPREITEVLVTAHHLRHLHVEELRRMQRPVRGKEPFDEASPAQRT